jgi:hypothetical protein
MSGARETSCMLINHHIAAALATERQRELVDGGSRWRRAERPVQAAVELPAPLAPQREVHPVPSAAAVDGRLRIVGTRRLGDARPANARSRERTLGGAGDRAGTR